MPGWGHSISGTFWWDTKASTSNANSIAPTTAADRDCEVFSTCSCSFWALHRLEKSGLKSRLSDILRVKWRDNVFVGLYRNRATYVFWFFFFSSAEHPYHRNASIGVFYIQGQRSSLAKFYFPLRLAQEGLWNHNCSVGTCCWNINSNLSKSTHERCLFSHIHSHKQASLS